MKEFNLKEYLENPERKVVTRDGKSVKIHCTNYLSEQLVIAEIEGLGYSTSFDKYGRYNRNKLSINDLFFASEKHEGWMNLYKKGFGLVIGDLVRDSEEEAKKIAAGDEDYITTIKVEWED